MKLLILTQYYPPEIGAPQNRLHELAVRLIASGLEVDVLTAMPNYPKMEIFEEYKDGAIKEEMIDGVRVYRAPIYIPTSKRIIPRLLNYFSFVKSSYKRGKKLGNYDFLMVESPPLFLGYSAMRLCRRLNARLIFNVSDLWPESAEKLNIITNRMLLGMAYRLEAKCYRRATLITGQTQGIVKNIQERFPEKRVEWLPNGVDVSFYDPERFQKTGFRAKNGIDENDLVLFYGGILGHAQGLEILLHAAKKITDRPVKFVVQGAGPEKEMLLELRDELELKNVLFLPPVPKSEMPNILLEIDVAIVPLKKLELFQGAIPSKIFEALAMKKALLLGVQGEAQELFITQANAGLAFEPENVEDLVKQIVTMERERERITRYGENGRAYVNSRFNRNQIAQRLVTTLRSLNEK